MYILRKSTRHLQMNVAVNAVASWLWPSSAICCQVAERNSFNILYNYFYIFY